MCDGVRPGDGEMMSVGAASAEVLVAGAAGGSQAEAVPLFRGGPLRAAGAQAARDVALPPRGAVRAGGAPDAGAPHSGRNLPPPLSLPRQLAPLLLAHAARSHARCIRAVVTI